MGLRKMLLLNMKFKVRQHITSARGPAVVRLSDPIATDALRRCNFTIHASVIYSQCFLSTPLDKTIKYEGCENTVNFTHCVRPTQPCEKMNTYVNPVNITANISTQAPNSVTLPVELGWSPYVKFHVQYYTIMYAVEYESSPSAMEYVRHEVNVNVTNITESSQSFDVRLDRTNGQQETKICFVIHAMTRCSDDPPAMYNMRLPQQEKCVSLKPDDTDPSNDAVIGVTVAGSVGIVALLAKIFRDRQRRRELEEKMSKETASVFVNTQYTKEAEEITDDWELHPDEIELGDRVGVGAFGVVYKGRVKREVVLKTPYAQHCAGGTLMGESIGVAVKTLKEDNRSKIEKEDFRNEIEFMKTLGFHDNIVNLIGCSLLRQPLFLVVEYMSNSDLLQYLRKIRAQLNDDEERSVAKTENLSATSTGIGAENVAGKNGDDGANNENKENNNK